LRNFETPANPTDRRFSYQQTRSHRSGFIDFAVGRPAYQQRACGVLIGAVLVLTFARLACNWFLLNQNLGTSFGSDQISVSYGSGCKCGQFELQGAYGASQLEEYLLTMDENLLRPPTACNGVTPQLANRVIVRK
jgi:hypothetical protein